MGYYSIEASVVAWVQSLGYACGQLMQRDRRGMFVTIERVGGGVSEFNQSASIAMQVWAESNAEAEAVSGAIVLRMLTEQPPAGIHSVEVDTGPYFYADLETDRPRYQTVLDVYAQLVD